MGSVALSRERVLSELLQAQLHARQRVLEKMERNRAELCFEKRKRKNLKKISSFSTLFSLHSSTTTPFVADRHWKKERRTFLLVIVLLHTMSLRLALYQERKAWRPGEVFRATLEVILERESGVFGTCF